jgi:hypothetical protein
MSEPRYPISTIRAVVVDLDPEFDTATVRKWRQRPGIVPSDEEFEAEGTTSTATYSLTFAVWLRVLLELNRKWGVDLANASRFAQVAAAMGTRRARVIDAKGGGPAVDKGYEYLLIPDPKRPDAARMATKAHLAFPSFSTGRSCGLVIDVLDTTRGVKQALAELEREEPKP